MRAAIMENKNVKTNDTDISSSAKFNGAIIGIVGGLLLMLTGLILSAISLFAKIYFHSWEAILIAASFPFLAVGAHFFDLMDKEKKARIIEYYKKWNNQKAR